MKIITELELREAYKEHPFDSYQMEKSARMTPAATEFLNGRKIRIISETGETVIGSQHRRTEMEISERDIKKNTVKPEEFTHLHGSKLVLKTNEVIKFRGKLDSLQACLISLIIEVQKKRQLTLAGELEQVLAYLRKMMRAEVLQEPLEFIDFNGWSEGEIRKRSHNPKEYYGIGHFVPDPSQGEIMAGLNQLRTRVRELELVAVGALMGDEKGLPRKDILLALNRLSSLVYILMCQYLGGVYGQDEVGE